MKNTGYKPDLYDPRDVYIDDLEFGSSDDTQTRWGLSDEQVKQLKKDNQRKLPSCVGQTGAKMMEILYGKDYSARYIYAHTDKLFEKGNRGGLQPRNMFKFLQYFGAVEDSICPDRNTLDFEEYYTVPTIKKGKTIFSYAQVAPNAEAIKTALTNFDIASISVRGYRYNRFRKRFYRDKKRKGGHCMTLLYMEKVKGEYILHVWNSWGDGEVTIHLKDFEDGGLYITAGTKKTTTKNKIKKVVTEKKKTITQYKYFKPYEVVGLDPVLVKKLDLARGKAGVPFSINSGKRTVARNKAVGGVANSSHLTGKAVDIKCNTSSARLKIVESLREVGFNRIGIAKTFIHADIDEAKPQHLIWLY